MCGGGGKGTALCWQISSDYFFEVFFFEDFLLLFLPEAEVFLLPVEVAERPAMAFFEEELDLFEEEVAFFNPFALPLPLPELESLPPLRSRKKAPIAMTKTTATTATIIPIEDPFPVQRKNKQISDDV